MLQKFRSTFAVVLRFVPVTFVLMSALLFMTSCASQRTIVHDLDEKDANEIIVLLANKNINAEKVKAVGGGTGGGGSALTKWDIVVDDTRGTEAIAILNLYGLPRRPAQNLLNIFSKGGLVPSEMEERIKYQSGLAEQIASTIRKIDGILDAEVQLSIPAEEPMNPNAPKQKVTASVYIKHTGILDDPNSQLITKIRRLVASSIPSLDFDNVTVIPDRARFTDIPFRPVGTEEEGKQYASVWTIVLAKDSVTRFRVVFFSFFILLVLLFLSIVWLGWKFSPIIRSVGFKQLFTKSPIHADVMHKNMSTAPPTAQEAKKIAEDAKKEQTDQEIE